MSGDEDVTRQVALLRGALGCGATFAAFVLATFAAFAVATVTVARDATHVGEFWSWVRVGWMFFLVAAPAGAGLAVFSRRFGRSLERSARTMWLGCLVPLAMAVAGIGGAVVLFFGGDGVPASGRATDAGQAIAFGMMAFCFVTPLVGIVAAFFPRIGTALGLVLLVGLLWGMLQAT